MDFNPKYFDFIKARVVGVTVPTVDFIPDSEGIISYCARVSNPSNQQNFESAAGLLKYCMKNGHWSVFDMANILIEVEAPRDIARQVLRHSSMKFQEFSQRYAEAQGFVIREARLQDDKDWQNSGCMANILIEVEAPRDIARQVLRHSSMKFQEFSQRYAEAQNFHVRETRLQDKKNRQNSIELDLTDKEDFDKCLEWEKRQGEVIALVKEHYAWAIENDIAKECARVILPEGNTMSYMYANTTVRSAITYLNVRDDEGVTQKEHVYLAKVIKPAIIEHFPFLQELLEK